MDKLILSVLVWLFFLGGLFGFIVGLVNLITGGGPAQYGVMGIGGGRLRSTSATR